MSYTNLNNPANYQLQSFGQDGMRTISTTQAYVEGEYYRVLVATEDSTVSATSMVGDDLVEVDVFAGTTIYGLFTAVSVSLGEVTAYLAGRTDIDDVWAYIRAYGEANGAIIEGEDCAKAAISPLLDKYYAQASLVMVPSLYKTSIVYSERPLSTDGQLTFTRNSDATRVNEDGLIEKVRTNLARYSEQFDNATAYFYTQSSISANAVANPLDGATTADKLVEDATNNLHRIGQTNFAITSGVPITFSIYAKAAERTFIEFQRVNSVGTVFNTVVLGTVDLSNGTLNPSASGYTSFTSVSVGGGWYRLSITLTPIATGAGGINISLAESYTSVSYLGDGTSGAYLFGLQVEYGDVPTDYIPTTTSARSTFAGITVDGTSVPNVPRLDYSGGASCPSLLLEPQRTNKVVTQYLTDPVWNTSAGSVTVEAGFLGPDGYNSAYKVTNISGGILYSAPFLTDDARTIYARTVSGTGKVSLCSHNANTNNLFDLTEEWQRFTVTSAPDGVPSNFYAVDFRNAGCTLSEVLLAFPQAEVGSYATSYIPTLGSAVTRLADAASKTGISSLLNSSAGVLYAEIASLSDDLTNRFMSISDGSNDNRVLTGYRAVSNQIFARIEGNNSTPVDLTHILLDTKEKTKIAISFDSSFNYKMFVNGVLVDSGIGTDSIIGLNRIDFTNATGTENFFGKVHSLIIFPTALTSTQLAELTTL